jgi:lysine 2,3-aminomutase
MQTTKLSDAAFPQGPELDTAEARALLWMSDPQLHEALQASKDIEAARHNIMAILHERESRLHARDCQIHALERSNALHCLRVMRNFLSPRNERVSGTSVVQHLLCLEQDDGCGDVHPAFVHDIMHIMKGATGAPVLALQEAPDLTVMDEREGSRRRSDYLDGLAKAVEA